MTTDAPFALKADACPEPEVLAAYIDGRLRPVERTTIDRHLANCADCREIVAGSVEAIDEIGGRAAPRSRTKLWVGLGAVLAAAAAVVIAVRMQRPSPFYVPEMAQLVAVQPDTRAIEPRLAGFRYAPAPRVTRGTPATDALELSATAEKVRNEIAARTDANADAARGVTYLLDGDPGRAVEALQRATSTAASPLMFSDLAAAYLQRGARGDAEQALAAANHALAANPTLREGAFNRALALESLGRRPEAQDAWRAYLTLDADSGWAGEARRHLAGLQD